MSRPIAKLQYEIKSKQNWSFTQDKNLYIPQVNRPFEHTKDEFVIPIVNMAYDGLKNEIETHSGQFLVFYDKTNDKYYIYDGQHRVTIYNMVIIAICYSYSNSERGKTYIKKLSKYQDPNDVIDKQLNEEEEEIVKENGWTYYPKLVSAYDFDFQAYGDILNNMLESSESKIIEAYEHIKTWVCDNLTTEAEKDSFLRYIFRCVIFDVNEFYDENLCIDFFLQNQQYPSRSSSGPHSS